MLVHGFQRKVCGLMNTHESKTAVGLHHQLGEGMGQHDQRLIPKISIVLINWKASELLKKCLASILEAVTGMDLPAEVIIINNSNDDPLVISPSEYAPLKVQAVTNKANVGFARACNQGAALSSGVYLLFLNPDCSVSNESLARPLEFMNSHPQYGACGIQLRDEHGHVARSCAQLPRAYSFMFNAIGLHHLFPGLADGFHLTHWPHNEDCDIDHIIGAFYFIRSDVFREMQGFDERFLVYLEDLDLSCRLKKAGYSIRYIASVSAFHVGGGASAKALAARLYYSLSSRLRYCRKHHSFAGFFLVSALTLCVEPIIRFIFSLSRSSPLAVRDVSMATVWLWRDFIRTRGGQSTALAR